MLLSHLLAETTGELQTIWEFAQLCGAGGLAVAGVGWWFWRKDKNEIITSLTKALDAEREYLRKADKETLIVLQELTSVIADSEAGGTGRHSELVQRIDAAVQTIVERINARPN